MVLRNPPRPRQAAAPVPPLSPGRGKLIVVVLMLVVLGAGYVALKDKIPGAPGPRASLPTDSLKPYIDFWDEHAEAAPPEFTVAAVTGLANDCTYGAMPRNTPQYLTADGFGRARGGYVCLFGQQTATEDLRCPAPGTNRWRAQNGLSPRSIYRVVEGHIIGKGLGGDGSATLNGSCVNMVPQSSTANGQMGVQAEKHAKGLAETQPYEPVFYLVVPVYEESNYMPDEMAVFIISVQKSEAPGPFVNETYHIGSVGIAT